MSELMAAARELREANEAIKTARAELRAARENTDACDRRLDHATNVARNAEAKLLKLALET